MQKLKAYFDSFWRYRYLLMNLVGRDFKLKYRRSVLGVLWSVLNPLLMCVVYWVVFSSMPGFRGNIPNFPVYLLCGQLMFSFFNDSTTSGMGSVVYAAQLLKKVYIPKYIFPLQKCCFALVNCVFSCVALFIVMLVTGNPLHPTILLAVYPMVTLFLFNFGVALFLSAFTVFFRDVMHMWQVFTTALMYFSAVFYDPATLGSIGGFNVQSLIRINPLYWYITGFRQAVLYGEVFSPTMVLVCGGCAAFSMLVGLVTFKKTQDKFVLHI